MIQYIGILAKEGKNEAKHRKKKFFKAERVDLVGDCDLSDLDAPFRFPAGRVPRMLFS